MVRTSQIARGRSLRASTRIAALLGAAALSTVSGIAYAATQPIQPRVAVQADDSASPAPSSSGISEPSPSSSASEGSPGNGGPTETASPEPPGNGGSGGGGPQG